MNTDILKFTDEGIEVKHINQIIKWVKVRNINTIDPTEDEIKEIERESESGR